MMPKMQSATSDSAETQYEERIICFIDLLGFKSTIEESCTDATILTALHEALSELQGEHLVHLLQGSVPVRTSTGEFISTREAGIAHIAQQNWPLVVTQFSDSFVLSCSASNKGAGLMLLRAIKLLQNVFFEHLGMLMRGGMSKGKLIHTQGGLLFGPAMIDAHKLESQDAKHPRVLISADAAQQLHQTAGSHSPIFTADDEHNALDLVSCLASQHLPDSQEWHAFTEQLARVKADILCKCPAALPKVDYLEHRLRKQSFPAQQQTTLSS